MCSFDMTREAEDVFAFISEAEIYIRLPCQYKNNSNQEGEGGKA